MVPFCELDILLVGEDGEGFGYEEIMSDEEELPEYQYEEEWLMEEWEDWLKPFTSNQFHMQELQYLVSPTITEYQLEYEKWKARLESEGPDLEEEPHQVSDVLPFFFAVRWLVGFCITVFLMITV